MQLGMGLFQEQKHHLSQYLVQSLRVLEMDYYELRLAILEEMQNNPLLEFEDEHQMDWERWALQQTKQTHQKQSVSESISIDIPDSVQKINLHDHLMGQLRMEKTDPVLYKLATFIIGQLDDKGYFDVKKYNKISGQTVSELQKQKALRLVQSFDPIGIAANDLAESLHLQLVERYPQETKLLKIIDNNFDWFLHRDFGKIQHKYKVKAKQLDDFYQIIKRLNPFPAYGFDDDPSPAIFADLRVDENPYTGQVKLTRANHFPIYINQDYQAILIQTKDESAKRFIKNKLDRILQMKKNIEQRNQTILSIGQAIWDIQAEAVLEDKKALQPLLMKEIARQTGYHESTVSRSVNGKYLQTPKGIIHLSDLFTSSIICQDGSKLSDDFIKKQMQYIIRQEDKRKPYSDQAIANLLQERGIKIARRTISKYRESLQILPSHLRRKM